MNKLRVSILFILLTITLSSFGQRHFVREITYQANKDENTSVVRERAITEIKRILLDELGTYIISEAKREANEDDAGFEESFKSKTQSFSMSLMKTKIIEERRHNKSFYVKVVIDVDDIKLKENLEDAGFADEGDVLKKVFEMLRENNVSSVSTMVLNTTDMLLNGLSLMEYRDSGERVFNVSRNFQGQVLNGDIILSGSFKIIYHAGNYVVFALEKGYVTGVFERYDSNSVLLEKGEFEENRREGMWENYRVMRNESYRVFTVEYKNGMKNGKKTQFDMYDRIVNIKNYEDDVAITEEIYLENGEKIFKGPLDKLGNKEGEWILRKGEKILVKSHYKNGKREGDFVSYYISGQVSEEGSYVNGNPIGVHKEYYINGQLQVQKEYDAEGKRTGDTYQYYKNGTTEATYVCDVKKRTKKVMKYYEDGTVRLEENYILGQKNSKNGKHLSYYEDGTLREESNYIDNKQVGSHIKYFADGSVQSEENYVVVNGRSVKDGALVEYDNYKQLRKKENYIKGVYNGLQTFYSKGVKSAEEEYKNGVKCMDKEFYSNGQLKIDNKYPGNDQPSIEKRFYESGQLQSLIYHLAPKNGSKRYFMKTGEHKTYAKTGMLLNITNYTMNKKNGLSIDYDGSGKVKFRRNFVQGELHGSFTSYFHGALREFGQYKDGKRSGIWFIFGNNDEVEEISYGENGRKLDSKSYLDAAVKMEKIKRLE